MREVKHGYIHAEYKDTGRKIFNTYLDINDPYGSIYRIKITAVSYQHLFFKSKDTIFGMLSPLVPFLLCYLQ